MEEELDIIYRQGLKVWLPDKNEGWVIGVVDHVDERNIHVMVDGIKEPQLIVKTSRPAICNKSHQWLNNDMTTLNNIHEPAVLHTLQNRFLNDLIYTYSGIVLVSVNPFQRFKGLYKNDTMKTYRGQQMGDLEPHLFAVAEEAYQSILRDDQSQSIIVSGESGAGKTVSSKHIMSYLAGSGGNIITHNNGGIEDQIMASNPILEAIGNAKTTRNDNSSRFGKFMQLQLSERSRVCGAVIRTYLLEKSRVAFHGSAERNYHIFYQLIAGASNELRSELRLLSCKEYKYLNQGVEMVADMDDKKEFEEVCAAMETLGINEEMRKQLWQCLAGILYLGNLECTERRGIKTDDPALGYVAKLLGVDAKNIVKWVNKRRIQVGKEVMLKPNTRVEQTEAVDSLSKTIYSCLFDWLVLQMNTSVEDKNRLDDKFIGILDIYGFESFEKNSFEQFCINYANENLQQQFNAHMFKKEQELYIKEGIEWSFIGFVDNKPCLDMIEGKLGILDLLDEECIVSKGSDAGLCDKVCFQHKGSDFLFKPKMAGSRAFFTIRHYAHDVMYDCDGFLEKNRDKIADELLSVIRESSNSLLTEIIPAAPIVVETKGRKPKSVTVGSKFKSSLQLLMKTIHSTNTHYIRCLKPNILKKPSFYDRSHILEQLRACGILSTIKISQAGYPGKLDYDKFYQRYKILLPGRHTNQRAACEEIVQSNLKTDNYQFGKTFLFLRSGQQALLESTRTKILSRSCVVIQKVLKGNSARKAYLQKRYSIIRLQAFFRAIFAQNVVFAMVEDQAATTIQKAFRGYLARVNLAYLKFLVRFNAAKKIQAVVRMFIQKNSLRRQALKNDPGQSMLDDLLNDMLLESTMDEETLERRLTKNITGLNLDDYEPEPKSESEPVPEPEPQVIVVEDTERMQALLDELADFKHSDKMSKKRYNEKMLENQTLIDELELANKTIAELKSTITVMKNKQIINSSRMSYNANSARTSRYSGSKRSSRISTSRRPSGGSEPRRDSKDINQSLQVSQKGNRDSKDKSEQKSVNRRSSALPSQFDVSSQAPPDKYELERVRSKNEKLMGANEKLADEVRYLRQQLLSRGVDLNEMKRKTNRKQEIQEDTPEDTDVHLFEFESKKIGDIISIATYNLNAVNCRSAPLAAFIISRCMRYCVYYNKEKELAKFEMLVKNDVRNNILKYNLDVNLVAFWITNFVYLVSSLTFEQHTVKSQTKAMKVSCENTLFFCYRVMLNILEQTVDEYIDVCLMASEQDGGFFKRLSIRTKSMANFLTTLTNLKNIITANSIPEPYAEAFFDHIANYLSHNMINRLILRRELCTWPSAQRIKQNLQQLRAWFEVNRFKDQALGLEAILQATTLLSFANKIDDNVPTLTMIYPEQVRKILINYRSDFGETIPEDVIYSVERKLNNMNSGSDIQELMDIRFASPPGLDFQRYKLKNLEIPANIGLGFLKDIIV